MRKITPEQAKRNISIAREFDKMVGTITDKVHELHVNYRLTASQIRNILRNEGRIGRDKK